MTRTPSPTPEPPATCRYLVTGSTGYLAGLVRTALLSGGHRVRLLTRAGRDAAAPDDARIDMVRGDVADPTLLENVLTGVDAMFLVCGETPDRPRFETMIIDATAAQRVHIVKLSAVGAAADAPTLLRWHHETEEHLRDAHTTWTVLRANSFMDNLIRIDHRTIAAGRWLTTLGSARVSLLAGPDLADVAATILTDARPHAGQVYELTGPQALSPTDIAAITTEALGHRVTAVPITPEQLADAMQRRGVPEDLAAAIAELHAWLRDGGAAAVTNTVERLLGRPATPLADFLAAHRAAFDVGDEPS